MNLDDPSSTPAPIQSDREAVRVLLARVREHRLHHNWTQAEVARRAGITRASYQNFENGFGNIRLTNLVRVFGVLGLTDRFAQMIPPVAPEPTFEDLMQPRRLRARTRKPSPTP